ncbi:hypothetical protein SAV31267_083540 [Streptomyces avermitilis]|uniref:HTH gntR-type domain-containing protein n=1 Tax=Streptomyces avermitilis TaxID=33903 RepID=A0A4D4N5V8_STRAX|nr:hypothetical protein SAV31267_083540 [Streptomyces avermitilis]
MPGSDNVPTTGLTALELSGVRRLSALEAVRARIALAVDLGLLSPGERLPGTAQIARALDVSEITARRALVSLCGDGVLERRRGRNGGTLVAAHPTPGTVLTTETYRTATDAVHRLIDHRLALECGIAHLASVRASGEDLSELQEIVEEMDRAPSWAEFHGCDERFHLRLAEATGVPRSPAPTARSCASSTATTFPTPWTRCAPPTASTATSSTRCAVRTPPRRARPPGTMWKHCATPCS